MMRVIICLIFLGIVTAQKHPGDDKEPKKPRRRLTPKGTGSRADWAFCTKDKPCGEREGDCDGNDQCEAGLECGVDNCQAFHKDAHRLADCCVRKSGPASKCVVDTPLRLLTHYVDLGEDVTPESCIEACSILEKPGPEPKIPGYVFAGVQAGNQCYCGNSNISSTWHAPASECNMPCSGNRNEVCGGNMRMNIFETGIPWLAGKEWKKVFSHDASGGLFANLEEAKEKNVGDENALLYSILNNLEAYRTKKGYFHFKLCYPELTDFPFPCNEWTQTSNPVLESKITDYKAIKITWNKDGINRPFHGIGLSPASKQYNLIDDAPDHINWWTSIGSLKNWPSVSSTTIPGPHPYPVKKAELYVQY